MLEDSIQTDPRPAGRELYSRGKMEAERRLLDLHRQRGLPLVIVRPGVVLGEGTPLQHSGLGFWARDNHCIGWGLGDHPLPVVDVDDVADALVRLALHDGHDLDGQALNLCSQAPLSAREIVAEMRQATGRDLHFHPRPLWLSQTMEIGKWLVKKAGRRPGVTFPSYRDLKTRSLAPKFSSRTRPRGPGLAAGGGPGGVPEPDGSDSCEVRSPTSSTSSPTSSPPGRSCAPSP